MGTERKSDKTVMDAIRAANQGDHRRAAALFQRAGNQYRNPKEKEDLWNAAKRHSAIHHSD